MKYYILVQFTLGLDVVAYQEVDSDTGTVVAYKDLNGELLQIPAVTESHVVDATPERPIWAD